MMQLTRGDCIEGMKTMLGESIDCIVTDPPYGKSYRSNRQGIDRKRSNAREGDVIVREQFFTHIENDTELPTEWLREAYRVLKTHGAMYVFCHWERWGELACAVQQVGFVVKNMLVMNKSNHGMGDLKGQYAPKHELCLFATKGRHVLRFPNGRSNDVMDVPVRFSGAHRLHPNEKPVSWLVPFIENSSDEGNAVLDPFAGSASTAEACIVTRRQFVGYEIDESHYCTGMTRIAKAMRREGIAPPAIARELGIGVPDVMARASR